jgi:predicted glycogen debranching enzyme
MRYKLDEHRCRNLEISSHREWILTNGLGGYAMGTAAGINTRRYHGLLVAATNPPLERMVLLAGVEAFIQSEGNPIGLSTHQGGTTNQVGISTNQYAGAIHPSGYQFLDSFEVGEFARWRFRAGGMAIEKSLAVHNGHNACTVRYRNIGDRPLLLTLNPLVCHKPFHGNFSESASYPQELAFPKNKTLVGHEGITLSIAHDGARRRPVQGWYYRFIHAREEDRGLDARDDLFCPCELAYDLMPGEDAVLVASVGDSVKPLDFPEDQPVREFHVPTLLREIAEHFFVTTRKRKTIIAGYPWFSDWGRDTMISLPGLCLNTGRVAEARSILESYAAAMHQGLIPNRFGEQGDGADYNTVDATLWFANAIYKTLLAEWDPKFASKMMRAMKEVFEWHHRGTLFGIRVDPEDGLLTQGEPGVQLTWMDAKVNDWVVTPRHGKPVEVNGLWINALRVMEWLAGKLDMPAARYTDAAEKAESNYDRKFWAESRGHYLDTADPDDASLRPNQVISIALPFGPAQGAHALQALDVVGRELLTTTGLRTLGPREPGYKGKFVGPLSELDAAYHQGTVWPWLMGPYVTALVKLTGDRQEARRILRRAREMLTDYGLGGIAEVYDGDEPQNPGGCPWQAWSVAEILRAYVEDAGE